MAKPNWVHITPVSGSGNTTITVYVDSFYGNTDRTGTVTVTGRTTGVKTLNITQSKGALDGSPIPNVLNISSGGSGAEVTFTTNAKLFGVTTDAGSTWVNLPTSYTLNGISYPTTGSATTISGNPGASGLFTIKFLVGGTNFSTPDSSRSANIYIRWGYNTVGEAQKILTLTQTGPSLIHYTVSVSLMAVNPEAGDNCQWKLSCTQSTYGPTTRIDGQVTIYRNDGDFDIVSVNGTIDDDNNTILLDYRKNPDNISGQIGTGDLGTTSQTSGYVCDGIN